MPTGEGVEARQSFRNLQSHSLAIPATCPRISSDRYALAKASVANRRDRCSTAAKSIATVVLASRARCRRRCHRAFHRQPTWRTTPVWLSPRAAARTTRRAHASEYESGQQGAVAWHHDHECPLKTAQNRATVSDRAADSACGAPAAIGFAAGRLSCRCRRRCCRRRCCQRRWRGEATPPPRMTTTTAKGSAGVWCGTRIAASAS